MTVIFTKSNYYRKPKYRIITTITSKNVIKKALSRKSLNHLKNIIKNEKSWQDYLGNLGTVIKGSYFKKSLVYKYYNQPNIKTELYNAFIEKDYQKFESILDNCFKYLDKFPTVKLTSFSKEELIQYEKIFKMEPNFNDTFNNVANIDLVPDNLIFYKDKILHLDSEWVFNFPLEIGFLKTRTIFYLIQKFQPFLKKYPYKISTFTSNKIPCPITWLEYLKKYTNKEIDNYIQKEINFQKYINLNYNFDIKDLNNMEKSKIELEKSQDELEIIKSSRLFKFWPIYCKLKQIFLKT